MSLQVWLPLNGDIENKGLADVSTSTIGTVAYTTEGKIGKAFISGGTTQTTNGISIGTNFLDIFGSTASVAAWVKPLGNHFHYNGTIVSSGNWNQKRWAFGVSQDNTKVDVLCGNYNTYINCEVPVGQWTHLASTYDNGVSKLYKNGVYIGQLTGQRAFDSDASNTCVGRETYASGYFGFYGHIYDHVLSPKEVKEISKALTIHYTLDDFTLKSENIMPNSLTMELGSANYLTGSWRLAGTSNMDRTRVSISDSPYGSCYGFQNVGIQTANDGSCYGIDGFPTEANTVYTISLFARITSGTEGYAGFHIYNATHNGGSWTKVDKNYYVTPLNSNGRWTRCWLTFTTDGNTGRNIYIGVTTGSTSVTTQMCCVRIEKGTPNFDTIYDSSGYLHNVTPTVKIVDSTNTPRYSGCIQLDGFNDHIVVPYNATCPDNIFTVNLWFYKYSLGTKSYETLFGGPSGFEMDTRAGAATTLSLYMASTRGGNAFSPFALNTWYMVTMVRDGTHEMYYVNGNLEKTIDAKAMPTGTYFIGAWSSSTSQNYKGLISDFRLYNTPLSSSDILELYQTASSVDRNGNFYAYDFKEVHAS